MTGIQKTGLKRLQHPCRRSSFSIGLFADGCIGCRITELALLSLTQPRHQHGVIGRLDTSASLLIVSHLIQASLTRLLHTFEAGANGQAEACVGIVRVLVRR